jgi:hypothetical protein
MDKDVNTKNKELYNQHASKYVSQDEVRFTRGSKWLKYAGIVDFPFLSLCYERIDQPHCHALQQQGSGRCP